MEKGNRTWTLHWPSIQTGAALARGITGASEGLRGSLSDPDPLLLGSVGTSRWDGRPHLSNDRLGAYF